MKNLDMRKFVFVVMSLFVTTLTQAQEWFVGADVSSSSSLSENMKIGDMFTNYPGLNINVGYNFSRFWGARAALGFNPQSGYPRRELLEENPDVFGRYRFYAASGFIDGLFNLTELFVGRDRYTHSGLYLVFGAGALHTMMFDDKLNTPQWRNTYWVSTDKKLYPVARAGLLGSIKLTRNMDLAIEAKYNFVSDKYNGIELGPGSFDGYLDVNLGLRWFFSSGEKKHTKAKTPYIAPKVAKSEKDEPLVNGGIMRTGISFYYDFAQVPVNQRPNMERVAKFLSNYPEMKLIVHGYGDSDKVDDMERNSELAQQRADEVVDQLINRYGVARNRLSVKPHSGIAVEKGTEPDLIRGVEFEMVIR